MNFIYGFSRGQVCVKRQFKGSKRGRLMSSAGDNIETKRASWTFGGETALSFDEHVSKSVPFYKEGQDLVTTISDYFVKDDSICYDLGASTGALTVALAKQYSDRGSNAQFIGIDTEARMVELANERKRDESLKNLEFICDDVTATEFSESDFITAYYTVQFIRPSQRQELINNIYQSLKWGGAFVMFEKTRAPDARFQDIMVGLYDEYKLSVGYKPEEIFSKTRSLRGIMEPFSSQANIEMLQRAGFKDTITVMKNIFFEGFLSVK